MAAVDGVDADGDVHAYLGTLEAVDHRQLFIHPDGKVLTLPLIYLPDIVRPSCESPRLEPLKRC